MSDDAVKAKAKALYEANGNRSSCPPWEQLGDVTRGVWMGYAQKQTSPPPTKKAPVSRFAKYLK